MRRRLLAKNSEGNGLVVSSYGETTENNSGNSFKETGLMRRAQGSLGLADNEHDTRGLRKASSTRTEAAVPNPRHWGIVLSGGSGQRMQPLINDWLGDSRPKQYCTFTGSRSMFQHTLDRACSVVHPEHILTVVGEGHYPYLAGALSQPLPGRLIKQPKDAGTAPGVFLPAAYALLNDPEAVLVLFPSDHFVQPEAAFCQLARRAAELAESHRDRIILVGAVPDSPETDYGWVGPAAGAKRISAVAAALGAMNVNSFREKPGRAEARLLWDEGYLWNTMVIAVRAKTLWELGRKHLPEMVSRFDALLMVLRGIHQGIFDPKCEPVVLKRLYEFLAPTDFSEDLLRHAADNCMLLPMRGMDWSDWGRPERVAATLARLGRQPLFPFESMETVKEADNHRLQRAGVR